MRIKVRIEIDIDGAQGHYPGRLAWDHEKVVATDNPRFYGHLVQEAIEAATRQAIRGSSPTWI